MAVNVHSSVFTGLQIFCHLWHFLNSVYIIERQNRGNCCAFSGINDAVEGKEEDGEEKDISIV